MPLDRAFVEESLYGPEAMLIDEIVEVDRDASMVRARMPTHADLPITRHQRVHPTRHPRHVSGGLMVHMTGIVAFAHFYYVLDLRHSDGWTGYGVRIREARFRNLAVPPEPMILECRAEKIRRLGDKINAQYVFTFTQGDLLVYEGKQTALWMQVKDQPEVPGRSTPQQ